MAVKTCIHYPINLHLAIIHQLNGVCSVHDDNEIRICFIFFGTLYLLSISTSTFFHSFASCVWCVCAHKRQNHTRFCFDTDTHTWCTWLWICANQDERNRYIRMNKNSSRSFIRCMLLLHVMDTRCAYYRCELLILAIHEIVNTNTHTYSRRAEQKVRANETTWWIFEKKREKNMKKQISFSLRRTY